MTTSYPDWLYIFMQELRTFLRGDTQSRSLPVNSLRPYPERAEGDEKKQFTRAQIVTALREWLTIGVNGGTGTRPTGEVVDINGYKAFNDLNAATLSESGLAHAMGVTHTHTPARGKNQGVKTTYNTLCQTVLRIMRANTALPERKTKGRKLTADEKTWMRTNIGPAWWGPGPDGKTDPVVKAASIKRMDAEMHGNATPAETDKVAESSPVADTTAQSAEVSGVTARVVELRKEFPDMSGAEAKELAELGL